MANHALLVRMFSCFSDSRMVLDWLTVEHKLFIKHRDKVDVALIL